MTMVNKNKRKINIRTTENGNGKLGKQPENSTDGSNAYVAPAGHTSLNKRRSHASAAEVHDDTATSGKLHGLRKKTSNKRTIMNFSKRIYSFMKKDFFFSQIIGPNFLGNFELRGNSEARAYKGVVKQLHM